MLEVVIERSYKRFGAYMVLKVLRECVNYSRMLLYSVAMLK